MKKTFCALVLALIALGVRADTLDFPSWRIKLSSQQASGAAEQPGIDFTSRGLKVLANTYFDDNQTVADVLMINPKLGRRLDRAHLQATQSGTKFLSDGTVTTEYEIPLAGAILQTLMPKTGGGVPVGPMACPTCGQPWPEGREVPPGVSLVPLEEGAPTNYTGILIDARSVDFSFALFPRILNEDGRVVYGPEFFIPTYAADRGSVGYYDQYGAAQADDRVGYNPLRLNALRSAGRNNTDLVISNSDARRLHGSLENLKLLERCRVIILTD